jgi:hypothetical protein
MQAGAVARGPILAVASIEWPSATICVFFLTKTLLSHVCSPVSQPSSLIGPMTAGGIAQRSPPFDPILHGLPSSSLSFPPSLRSMQRPVPHYLLRFLLRQVVVRPSVGMRVREGSTALEAAFDGILPSEGPGASTRGSVLPLVCGGGYRRVDIRFLVSSGLGHGDLIGTLSGIVVPSQTEYRVQQMNRILP